MNNIDTPYSTCNAKGRCLRHPTIQLSRKKKLGGWKTLMSICPMCAMEIMKSGGDPNDYGLQLQVDDNNDHHDDDHEEVLEGRRLGREGACSREMRRDADSMSLHSHDRPAHRIGSGSGDNSSLHHRGSRTRTPRPPSSSSRHHQRYNNSDDRSTTGHSIHSAPSTFHRRDSQESGSSRGSSSREGSFTKGCGRGGKGGGFNSSDSSCDTTVYSSDSSRRSHHSSLSRGSSHNNNGQCRRPMGVPMRGHHDTTVVPQQAPALRPRHTIIQQQQQQQDEEEYVCGMSYQGMKYTGQIHVETRVPHGLGTLRSNDGMIWEGTWHFGHLVDNSQTQEEELCEKFNQYTTIQDAVSEDSSVSNSIAETIHDTLTEDEASYGSYTAREAKSSSSRGSNNVMDNKKMAEYSRYIDHCDETQDYYYQEDTEDDSDVSSISRSSSQHYHQKTRVSWNENLDDRQTNRRVRFCEDP